MTKEIKVKSNFFRSLKVSKLEEMAGDKGVVCLFRVWIYATKNKQNGGVGILETEKELLVKKYHFIPISIVLILLYLITFALFKLKIFTRLTHIIIWNCILLISFIVSSSFLLI